MNICFVVIKTEKINTELIDYQQPQDEYIYWQDMYGEWM